MRRDFLLMSAAATAVAAAPRVLAAEPAVPGDAGFSFYEKGNVRIRSVGRSILSRKDFSSISLNPKWHPS